MLMRQRQNQNARISFLINDIVRESFAEAFPDSRNHKHPRIGIFAYLQHLLFNFRPEFFTQTRPYGLIMPERFIELLTRHLKDFNQRAHNLKPNAFSVETALNSPRL